MRSRFTGENPNSKLRCSPVNPLHIFRTPFPKNTSGGLLLKEVTGKTPFWVHFVLPMLYVLTLAFDEAVLCRNDAFSILAVLTEKPSTSFSKMNFVFQKLCCKVKALETFKNLSHKTMAISQTESYLEDL